MFFNLVDFSTFKFMKRGQKIRVVVRRIKKLIALPFVVAGFTLMSLLWFLDNEVILSRFFKVAKSFVDKALQITMVWGNKI